MSLLFIAFALCISNLVVAQEGFVRTYDFGTNEYETARNIHVLEDGILLLSRGVVNDSLKTAIIKTDFDGEIIWSQFYSFYIDLERSIINDSLLFFSGFERDENSNLVLDGFTLYKLNLNGELLASQKYTIHEYANPPVDSIVGYASTGPVVYEDKIVVYGQIYELPSDTSEVFSRGLMVWYNMDLSLDTIVYMQPSFQEFDIWDAHIAPDGLLTLLVDDDAPTNVLFPDKWNYRYFVKYDKEGHQVWSSPKYQISHTGRFYLSSTILPNGDMLMYYEDDDESRSMIVVSMDKDGDVNWTTQLDPNRDQDVRTIFDIEKALDGHLLASGSYFDFTGERQGPFLCKLDKNTGELLWERVYLDWRGAEQHPEGDLAIDGLFWSIQVAENGTIYGIGDREERPATGGIFQDVLLMKLDESGCIEKDCGGFEQDVAGDRQYQNMFYRLSNWFYQKPSAEHGLSRIGFDDIQFSEKTKFEMFEGQELYHIDPNIAGGFGNVVATFLLNTSGSKIYQLENGDSILIYDFDLELGDTFESAYTPHTLEVVAIDTIRLLNEDYRKTWTLADPNYPENSLTWIEGIGTDYGMLWPPDFPTGDYGDVRLTCYYVYERLHYINEDIGGCFISDTEEASLEPDIEVFYPNPVMEQLQLYPDVIDHFDSYAIHGTGGKTVIYEKSLRDSAIDVSQLASGIYFLQLISKDKQLVKKFVKL